MRCMNSYMLNKNVFSLFLNIVNVMSGARSAAGRLFHTQGPWTVAVVCSGAWNSQSAGVSGLKTPAGNCWRRLTVCLKVLWSHVVQTLVDQNCCLERDPPSNRQPVKIAYDGRHMLWSSGSCDKTNGSVLDDLEPLQQLAADTNQQAVTVVQSIADKSMHESFCCIQRQWLLDRP